MDQTDEYQIAWLLEDASAHASFGHWYQALGQIKEAERCINEILKERTSDPR